MCRIACVCKLHVCLSHACCMLPAYKFEGCSKVGLWNTYTEICVRLPYGSIHTHLGTRLHRAEQRKQQCRFCVCMRQLVWQELYSQCGKYGIHPPLRRVSPPKEGTACLSSSPHLITSPIKSKGIDSDKQCTARPAKSGAPNRAAMGSVIQTQ